MTGGRARLALVVSLLLGLLAARADGTCAAAMAAVQTAAAAGGACADNGAGNGVATCSAACGTVLDGFVAGCTGVPLQNASSYFLMELARTALNTTGNGCRQAFADKAYAFSMQPGASDRTRPYRACGGALLPVAPQRPARPNTHAALRRATQRAPTC